MTINERIKYLRKDILKLNQTDFGKSIGLSQRGASHLEQEKSLITERVVKTICSIFNIREEWLREGIEPMYDTADVFSLDDFAESRGMTDLERKILKAYFELDPVLRHNLIEHFKNSLQKKDYSDDEKIYESTEELEEAYKKSRLNSVQKTALSVSNITAATVKNKTVNE